MKAGVGLIAEGGCGGARGAGKRGGGGGDYGWAGPLNTVCFLQSEERLFTFLTPFELDIFL
jgi:hypothetical protein